VEAVLSLPFGLTYRIDPEYRKVIEAWEIRALLAGTGVLAAYVLLRLRGSRRRRARRGGATTATWNVWAARSVCAGLAAGLWLAVDLLRHENFLGELLSTPPLKYENALKAWVLAGCGWLGWSLALGEFFLLLAGSGPQGYAHPSATDDAARDLNT
jgi:hypothetical protein